MDIDKVALVVIRSAIGWLGFTAGVYMLAQAFSVLKLTGVI